MLAECSNNSSNTVSLDSRAADVVRAIQSGTITPLGDYGGQTIYLFQADNNALGNIIYTTFDRITHLGLASFTVRYGAATTIRQVITGNMPRSLIDLRFLILPLVPPAVPPQGRVIPG